jgi:outer membrane lipoprotein-sorting protein
MKFLRTAPTRRLLAAIAGLVVAIAAGGAIAVAASSGGPKPNAQPLANALHQALSGKSVTGITAHITFTNHLISSSNIQGSDPILTGANGRLWLSPGHGLRLELQSTSGNGQDAEIVLDHGSFSVYDPMTNTVYKGKLPADTSKQSTSTTKPDAIPSVSQIQTQLKQLLTHLNLAGPTPNNIAGQEAYTVKISPKHDGGLLGQIQLGWDALHGIPLDVALYAKHSTTPVLELSATDISYGPVSTSDLQTAPPTGAKVVTVSTPPSSAAQSHGKKGAKSQPEITGPAAVAKHVKFGLKAPNKLDGLPRQSVQLLDWGGSPAALVTYGQNLGGIAVIEQTASSTQSTSAKSPSSGSGSGSGDHGLSLPTVSIHGATGTELPTAIGTVLRFTRGGVTYTVLGSVPPAAAELAAKAL